MRIVTYNTRGSLGMDGVRATRRIVEVVRALTPDVVAFQEIHQRLLRSGGEDQPSVLGRGLNRSFSFQRLLRSGRGGYGIGIATRDTVQGRSEHLLPSDAEQRGALEVRLRDGHGSRITVFNTHWGLDAGERVRQAEALVGHVKAAAGPVVVCGDLNEGADGEGLKLLLAQTGLRDSDAILQRPTFPSISPTQRIDFILHSADLMPTRIEVVDTAASDHLPLLVDFTRI